MPSTFRRLLSVYLWVCPLVCWAQTSWLFDTRDGLPSSLINQVAVDANQMIWVVTEDGLCRFDGYNFVSYKNQPGDEHSLQSNYVRTVYCDATGRVMVGTRRGLQLYRPATDDFSPLVTFADGSLTRGDVTMIMQRSNSEMWVAGNTCCGLRIDDDGRAEFYPIAMADSVDYVQELVEDAEGNVWANRYSQRIVRVDKQGHVERMLHNGADIAANRMCCTPDGHFYVGSAMGGLYRYNKQSGDFDLLAPDWADCLVRDIDMQDETHLLVATDNQGLLVYDMVTNTFTPYTFDNLEVNPRTQKVHDVAFDAEGNLWMGLYQKGLLLVPQHTPPFHQYGAMSRDHNCVGDKCVTALCYGRDGLIWVATDNGGLYAITPEGEQRAHFDCHGLNAQSPNAMTCLYEDRRGRLWYGTYNQGYGWVDRRTGRFHNLALPEHGGPTLDVYGYAEDAQGRVWAATMGQGVLMYDEQKGSMQPLMRDSCSWCNAILYDAATQRMYVGSYNGLTVVDLDQNGGVGSQRQYLGQDVVFAVRPLGPDSVCLCLDNGMAIIDMRTGQSHRYSDKDGLPNGNCYAALADAQGHLWLASNVCLSCFDLQSHRVYNFSGQDGLSGNGYSRNCCLQHGDGTLWFGGMDGIVWFDPASIGLDSVRCKVRITGLKASNMPALNMPDISYEDNSLTISMGTIPLLNTRRALYSYSLDDEPWQTLPLGVNSVYLSHVPMGSHTFSYRAMVDGTSTGVSTYSFRILPPWYLQWWSILLAVVAIVAVAVFQIVAIRHRRRVKQELQQSAHQQAIADAKIQFFANIAHEIRTPLTLILGPLGNLMQNDADEHRQHSYGLILCNSNRLLSLMNQLLDVRKIENDQMQLLCQQSAVGEYTEELCRGFEDVAALRHVTLEVHNEWPASDRLWIDLDQYNKILSNLLTNALKYTPAEGKVEVQVALCAPSEAFAEGSMCLTVTDTGRGIPDADKPHIFERFYQVRSSAASGMGTGIGLYLTYQLVLLHHGTIQLVDNPAGKGSRFIIHLPMGHSHLQPDEMLSADEMTTTETAQTYQPHQIAATILSELTDSSAGKTANPTRLVLVVEDDNDVREYIRMELETHYKVRACSNGEQALAAIKEQAPDLIVSDVMMPVMDGLTLCQKVRQNVLLNHIPIILVSAKTADEDKVEGMTAGADAYLAKPFSMDLLKATIENQLSNHAMLRNVYKGQQNPAEQLQTPEAATPDERLMNRLLKVVEVNLGNQSFTVQDWATEVGMSRVHLFRKVKELTNQTPSEYLRNIRLAKAAELLKKRGSAVAEVAMAVGFESQSAFATAFKDLYGKTPTEYKKG